LFVGFFLSILVYRLSSFLLVLQGVIRQFVSFCLLFCSTFREPAPTFSAGLSFDFFGLLFHPTPFGFSQPGRRINCFHPFCYIAWTFGVALRSSLPPRPLSSGTDSMGSSFLVESLCFHLFWTVEDFVLRATRSLS